MTGTSRASTLTLSIASLRLRSSLDVACTCRFHASIPRIGGKKRKKKKKRLAAERSMSKPSCVYEDKEWLNGVCLGKLVIFQFGTTTSLSLFLLFNIFIKPTCWNALMPNRYITRLGHTHPSYGVLRLRKGPNRSERRCLRETHASAG